MKRQVILASAAILLSLRCAGQVVSDWDKRDSIVTSMEEGTVKENDYAAEGICSDWSSMLSDFESSGNSDFLDSIPQERRNMLTLAEVTKTSGKKVNVPSVPDERGIDLFMLTREGILFYLALSSPAYYEEPDDDVVRWIRYYAYERRDITQRFFTRYTRWEPLIKKYFTAVGIPPEMAELCLVESGCTYDAVSSAGASGMWQIMPATGRENGLKVNGDTDDRNDPVLATQAAARILLKNYRRVGDWTLAAAAYNCGAGRITPLLKRNIHSWHSMKHSLPKETRLYIPSLLAIHYVWTYRRQLAL